MTHDQLKKLLGTARFGSAPQILVVDDKQESLLAIAVVLRSLGCEVITARSGKEAIDYVSTHPELVLIFLDIQMSVLDGHETAQKIRAIRNESPPIVFLTSRHLDDIAIERAYFFNERNVFLENALDAVIGMNQNQEVIDWNLQAEAIFGWKKNEVLGRKLADLIIPSNFREAHTRGVKHFIATGHGPILNRRIELPSLRRSGETFPIELTVVPIKTDSGYLFYSFVRDISERKMSEALLQKSKEALEQEKLNAEKLVEERTRELKLELEERKRGEEKLRMLAKEFEKQARTFDTALSSSPDFSYIFDINHRFTYVNRPLLKLWGLSPELAIGKNFEELGYPPELVKLHESQLNEVLRTKEPVKGENAYTNPEGKTGYYEYIFIPIFDESGKVQAISGTTRDVTTRKNAEEDRLSKLKLDLLYQQTKESEEQYRSFADSLPQLAWIARPDGFIFWYNAQWYRYTGTTEKDMEGWGWQTVHDPKILPSVLERWKHSLETGEPFEMEFPLRSASGEYRWFLTRVTPVREAQGNLVRWFGTNTDIHDTKAASERMHFLSEASAVLNGSLNFENMLSNLSQVSVPRFCDLCSVQVLQPDGSLKQISVAHVDPEKVNLLWELYAKYPTNQNLDSGPYKVIRTGKPDFFAHVPEENMRKAARDKKHLRLMRALDLVSYITVPMRARGKAIGTMSFATAGSRRRFNEADLGLAIEIGNRAGLALENARFLEESQRLNQIKDEFLATLSHELRTPLNVILGNADILMNDRASLSDEEREQSLSAIHRNADLQTQIIKDLLDVSSIITGKVSYKPERISPSEIANSIIFGITPTAEAKGVKLVYEESKSPATITADPTRLHQVFWNLISNAVKFTPRGGVVTVRVTSDNENCVIEVSDTGQGIEPEFLPYVFDRFSQEDSSMARKFGGLGLGLSIVRHLTELHGGSVKAESAGKNQGAKFTVKLPLKSAFVQLKTETGVIASANERAPVSPIELRGIKILLVEDSLDNQALITRMLGKVGAHVRAAVSAQQAREILKSFKPALILSDIGMPDETGIEFIKKLRTGGNGLKSVPAIALTAYVRPEEQERILQAGFNSHVAKPVTPANLLQEISQVLLSN